MQKVQKDVNNSSSKTR